MAGKPAQVEEVWHDLQPVLDEELNGLPDKYRAPVVLCYLEGKTNEEAGRLLRCPTGTIKGRLARARQLLRTRLLRRGVTLSTGMVGVVLAEHATAAVPAALVDATVTTALLLAAGPATALAEEALKGLLVTKLQTTVAVVLAVALAILGAGVLARQAQLHRPAESATLVQCPGRGKDQLQPAAPPAPAKAENAKQMAARVGCERTSEPLVATVCPLARRPKGASRRPTFLRTAAVQIQGHQSLFVAEIQPAPG
jgi:hypothetical protein